MQDSKDEHWQLPEKTSTYNIGNVKQYIQM